MPETLSKIEAFISKHHLLCLATSGETAPQVCNLYYAYDVQRHAFIVASETKTQHIQNVLADNKVACSVALETDEVGKIQGIQCQATMHQCNTDNAQNIYFKAFPFARVMQPTLWEIQLHEVKLTDNRLGFGKKLTWTRAVSA